MSIVKMMTDDAMVVSADGQMTGPFKTRFAGEILTFFDPAFHTDEGDIIVQKLPNNREKSYRVLSAQYRTGLGPNPASWAVKIQVGKAPEAPSVNYTINGANVQVGDHNIQNVSVTLQNLVAEIDRSSVSDLEKSSAKSKLREFLESPATIAVLGPVAQVVISALGS